MTEETLEQKWQRLAGLVGEKYDADIVLYSGDIEDGIADDLIKIVKQDGRRRNVVLMLATRGGSPDAAYRMARVLKRHYTKLILYIYGMCKSAGTLVAVGADELILSDFGEFGPLDIQLGKPDELFETVSGLNITQALASLNTRAVDVFRSTLVDLKAGGRGQISTRLAGEIATEFATGLYDKIYAQIDPAQLGAIERSINIASDYGKRLGRRTNNVKLGTIDKLVSAYPSHSFVIDLEEAQDLFEVVRTPDTIEEQLAACIAWVTRDPAKKAFVQKLNSAGQNEQSDPKTDTSANSQDSGGNEDHAAPASDAGTGAPAKPRAVK